MTKRYKALGGFACILLCSFLQQCAQEAPAPTPRLSATALETLANPAQQKLAQEQLSRSVYASRVASGEVVVVIVKVPVTSPTADSAKSGTPHAPTARYQQQTVCYNYYLVYYTNGVETGRDFLFTDCLTLGGDDGSGGGGGDGGSSGSGGGGGGGGSPVAAPVNVPPGQKPLAEYPNRCSGAQALWDAGINAGYAEAFGVITANGQLLITSIGPSGGTSASYAGIFPSYALVNGQWVPQLYYVYPSSQGAPAQNYPGMLNQGGFIRIPIIATVHTHTPCLNSNGTDDGVSNHILSQGDQDLSILTSNCPAAHNYIIGCSAVGLFDNTSNSPTFLQGGLLSSTCSLLQ